MFKALRNAFFTGLVILLPLGVTIIVIQFLISKVGTPTSDFIFWFIDPALRSQSWVAPLLDIGATIVVFLMITLLGAISSYFLGRLILSVTERIMSSVPFISTVYKTVKQIVETFSKQKKAVFQKCVLVEYPKSGTYALGFLTSTSKGEIQDKTKANVFNVFVPTTPNPTSGFLLMVPEDEIIDLEMSISDGMKLVISGGALIPGDKAKKIDDKSGH